MGKNKHKNRPEQQAKPPKPWPPVQGTPTAAAASTPPQAPEAAFTAVVAAHRTAVAAATARDVENLSTLVPTGRPAIDLVAAATLLDETLALCRAREDRLASRQADCDARDAEVRAQEARLKERETRVEESERALKLECARTKEAEAKNNENELELLVREEGVRKKELNAEAGFAAERRESLRQLDTEVDLARNELSRARAQISKERAEWIAEREQEVERIREEQRQALSAAKRARAELEGAINEELQLERAQLSKDRAELKKRAARLEIEQGVLHEDREAFDDRVARRAARELEEATAERQALEERLASARVARDNLFEKLRLRDEAERALGNRPLDEIKREIDALSRDRDSLKEQLAKRPAHDVTERLAFLERAQEDWVAERARLTQECMAAQTRLARSSIAVTEIETLRDQKAALETGRDLMHAALEELRKDVDERIRRADGASPFPSCSLMDVDNGLQTEPRVIDEISDLKEFCEDLQHRIATDPSTAGTILYYSLPDIRCFLGGLAMSRLHLLQGISGTGKTSLPLAVARAIGAGATLVEVQAGWRDRQDLIGHFNAFEHRYYESEFLQALYRAQCPAYGDLVNFVVLDEMNLSHPEQYFADLLSALEQNSNLQEIKLMTAPVEPAPAHLRNGRTLAIPQNMWFVGTANHDETTKDFADKTYDRAHVMELPRNREHFRVEPKQARQPISFAALRSAFAKAHAAHKSTAKRAYEFLDKSFAEVLGLRFRVGWGNRLERQMLDFVPVVIAAGGTVGEAVDHILASKLLRKIRDRHDTRPEDLTALRDRISEVWSGLDAQCLPTKSEEIVRDELQRLGVE